MKIALTGTPGTGKTSVAKILEGKYKVIHLNDFEDARMYYDEDRDTYVVDTEKLKEEIEKIRDPGVLIIESHYAQDMNVEMAIILRCHPDELKRRLKNRGYGEMKIMENVEAEAMGIITEECLSKFPEDKVYEIDTTSKTPEETAKAVDKIIIGEGEQYRKRINYMGEILKWY